MSAYRAATRRGDVFSAAAAALHDATPLLVPESPRRMAVAISNSITTVVNDDGSSAVMPVVSSSPSPRVPATYRPLIALLLTPSRCADTIVFRGNLTDKAPVHVSHRGLQPQRIACRATGVD